MQIVNLFIDLEGDHVFEYNGRYYPMCKSLDESHIESKANNIVIDNDFYAWCESKEIHLSELILIAQIEVETNV